MSYLDMVGRRWRILSSGGEFLAAEYDWGFFAEQELKRGEEIEKTYASEHVYVITSVSKVARSMHDFWGVGPPNWWEYGYRVKEHA